MVTQMQLFESPDPTQFDLCLWGSIKSEVYEKKMSDTRDELLTCILVAVAHVNKSEDQLTDELQGALRLAVGF